MAFLDPYRNHATSRSLPVRQLVWMHTDGFTGAQWPVLWTLLSTVLRQSITHLRSTARSVANKRIDISNLC